MSKQSITKDRAIAIAKELARKTYGDNLDEFEVRVEADAEQWKVNFVNPKAVARGDQHHFSVWVNKDTGEARLFRGR